MPTSRPGDRIVTDVVALALDLVGGCTGGYSGAGGRVGGCYAVARVGGREVSARSATATTLHVRAGDRAATVVIGELRLSVGRARVAWGRDRSLALVADWKRVEFVDEGTHVAVRVDGRAHAEIRPPAQGGDAGGPGGVPP